MRLLILAVVFLCGSVVARTEPVKVPTDYASSSATAFREPTVHHGRH